jgi:chromosome condensin MukBEF ATPase and DNA-binding subunit MukB
MTDVGHQKENGGRPMNAKKIVETDHGAIDADVLAELQRSFATAELLMAIDRIDANEGRQKWLRTCLMRLHAMANHLIDGAPQTVTGQEAIWQLAEEIGDELDASTANLSHVLKLVDRLGQLRPNG